MPMPKNQEAENQDTGQEDSKGKPSFMSPGAMSEWAEEANINIFDDPESPPEDTPEPESETKDDDKSDKMSADKNEATDEDKSEEGKTPSKEEQKSEADERHTERTESLEDREKRIAEQNEELSKKIDQLNEILTREGQGQQQVTEEIEPDKKESQEDKIDLDDIDDPAARNTVKTLLGEISGLKRQIQTFEQFSQKQQYAEVRKGLEATMSQARQDYPFEDVVDEKTGRNVAMEAVSSIVAIEAQKDKQAHDRDHGYKMRSLKDLFSQAAQTVQALQKAAKSETKSEPVTAENILKEHPEVAKEIGEAYLANYQKEQSEGAPIPKGNSREASTKSLQDQREKEKHSGDLRDRIRAGLNDPDVWKDLKNTVSS